MTDARLQNIIRRSRYWESTMLSVVKITHSTVQAVPYAHEHPDFYELVIVWEGHARHHFKGKTIPISAGHVFLVPPRVEHVYLKPGPLSIYNVIFGEELLPTFQHDLMGLQGFQLLFHASPENVLRLDPAYFPEIIKLVEEMETGQRNIHSGAKTMLLSNFLRLLLLVSEHSGADAQQGGPSHVLPLSQLLAALDSRYGEDWSLKSMTAFTRMSDSNFRHQFRNLTGMSPIGYLLKLRLHKAAAMLSISDSSIAQTASRCGFVDSNYFSRQFRREFGQSPSRFRHQGRGGV